MSFDPKREFISVFNDLSRKRHRYEVFKDFVTCASAALHNALAKSQVLEERYMEVVKRYDKEEMQNFPVLLALLVEILEPRPADMLGQLYMELDIGSNHMGQYFSPPDLSFMLARLQRISDTLKEKPYITLHEPACGAGGMVLAIIQEVVEAGYNPATSMWVQCIDIDRTAAMMCYIQLALWNVPAEIIVGNVLSMKFDEIYYTPAHYLNDWEGRLKTERTLDAMRNLLDTPPPLLDEQLNTAANSPKETVIERASPIVEPSKSFEIKDSEQMTLDL